MYSFLKFWGYFHRKWLSFWAGELTSPPTSLPPNALGAVCRKLHDWAKRGKQRCRQPLCTQNSPLSHLKISVRLRSQCAAGGNPTLDRRVPGISLTAHESNLERHMKHRTPRSTPKNLRQEVWGDPWQTNVSNKFSGGTRPRQERKHWSHGDRWEGLSKSSLPGILFKM